MNPNRFVTGKLDDLWFIEDLELGRKAYFFRVETLMDCLSDIEISESNLNHWSWLYEH